MKDTPPATGPEALAWVQVALPARRYLVGTQLMNRLHAFRFLASSARTLSRLNSRIAAWCTSRSIAAAVAIGVLKIRSHALKTSCRLPPPRGPSALPTIVGPAFRWAAASLRGTMFIVNLDDLEAEALKLPVDERARLAEALLESLDALTEDEHRRIWNEEAIRRDADLDLDPSRGRPAEDVFREARARLR